MANAQIIAAATSDDALKPYIRTTLRNLPVDPASYQLLDQAYVASLLYCLFVVPRHVLNLSSNDRLFANLNSLNPLQYFSISVEPKRLPEAPVFWLIQALRNSVAHALYEIDGQNNWRFWTEREPIWDARASETASWPSSVHLDFNLCSSVSASRKHTSETTDRTGALGCSEFHSEATCTSSMTFGVESLKNFGHKYKGVI